MTFSSKFKHEGLINAEETFFLKQVGMKEGVHRAAVMDVVNKNRLVGEECS